jgi:hypothetical protein
MDEWKIDDPMMKYQETLVTPEEKVIRERIYAVLPEVVNRMSLNNSSGAELHRKLYDRGLVTRSFVKNQPDYYTLMDSAMRKAKFSNQVTSIYCPMHVQTSTAVEMGVASCQFKAQTVEADSPSSSRVYLSTYKSEVEETGSGFLHPSQMYLQQVVLAQEDGIWKVDAIDLSTSKTVNLD